MTDLSLCRDVITLLQSRCGYYESLAQQFQGQLQDAVQLYQQSKSEVMECTQERLATEKQLQVSWPMQVEQLSHGDDCTESSESAAAPQPEAGHNGGPGQPGKE